MPLLLLFRCVMLCYTSCSTFEISALKCVKEVPTHDLFCLGADVIQLTGRGRIVLFRLTSSAG